MGGTHACRSAPPHFTVPIRYQIGTNSSLSEGWNSSERNRSDLWGESELIVIDPLSGLGPWSPGGGRLWCAWGAPGHRQLATGGWLSGRRRRAVLIWPRRPQLQRGACQLAPHEPCVRAAFALSNRLTLHDRCLMATIISSLLGNCYSDAR